MALEGSERKVLHAILREQGEAQAGYVADSLIAQICDLRIDEVRDSLEAMEGEGYVERSIGVSGHSAYITARGRQELRRSQVIGNDRGGEIKAPLRIVPKGLRSFDAEDKDFFLELLPGPRRGDGLPESVHFWKVRIEEMDPDKTFKVGVIYGPSGCGKSSLVKAGLLPRLSESVIPLFIEATENETETRLLKLLRKHSPDLPGDLDLPETFRALLARSSDSPKKKVVIVLDQFEQWLHAKRSEEESSLQQALSQCNGERVQTILMIRDDFWMPLTRFMGKVGIPLKQWENFTAIDLFDLGHARKVLTAFGQAFDTLPDQIEDLTKESKEFLEQTVNGLAQDGKIISVRLALFAEMVKGMPWTPATLKEMGGTDGVVEEFLEEKLSSTALRRHQRRLKPS
jgi:eukaryotic-like serine/threonine-protein kinase